jgi:predicted adenine nucleotide alpha hydrolase (AANH) superfamily ATPase
VKCIEILRNEGIEVTGFWYNTNIHPKTEYLRRLDTLISYAENIALSLEIIDEYGLRSFVSAVSNDLEARCDYCYMRRVEKTAQFASQNGYEAFSTTLLISPYQNHDKIIKYAQLMSEKNGIEFVYRDFRPHFREGQSKAREMGLYMQKYCGCIYSEEERYAGLKHYKG